jgi:hypothetical protein
VRLPISRLRRIVRRAFAQRGPLATTKRVA